MACRYSGTKYLILFILLFSISFFQNCTQFKSKVRSQDLSSVESCYSKTYGGIGKSGNTYMDNDLTKDRYEIYTDPNKPTDGGYQRRIRFWSSKLKKIILVVINSPRVFDTQSKYVTYEESGRLALIYIDHQNFITKLLYNPTNAIFNAQWSFKLGRLEGAIKDIALLKYKKAEGDSYFIQVDQEGNQSFFLDVKDGIELYSGVHPKAVHSKFARDCQKETSNSQFTLFGWQSGDGGTRGHGDFGDGDDDGDDNDDTDDKGGREDDDEDDDTPDLTQPCFATCDDLIPPSPFHPDDEYRIDPNAPFNPGFLDPTYRGEDYDPGRLVGNPIVIEDPSLGSGQPVNANVVLDITNPVTVFAQGVYTSISQTELWGRIVSQSKIVSVENISGVISDISDDVENYVNDILSSSGSITIGNREVTIGFDGVSVSRTFRGSGSITTDHIAPPPTTGKVSLYSQTRTVTVRIEWNETIVQSYEDVFGHLLTQSPQKVQVSPNKIEIGGSTPYLEVEIIYANGSSTGYVAAYFSGDWGGQLNTDGTADFEYRIWSNRVPCGPLTVNAKNSNRGPVVSHTFNLTSNCVEASGPGTAVPLDPSLEGKPGCFKVNEVGYYTNGSEYCEYRLTSTKDEFADKCNADNTIDRSNFAGLTQHVGWCLDAITGEPKSAITKPSDEPLPLFFAHDGDPAIYHSKNGESYCHITSPTNAQNETGYTWEQISSQIEEISSARTIGKGWTGLCSTGSSTVPNQPSPSLPQFFQVRTNGQLGAEVFYSVDSQKYCHISGPQNAEAETGFTMTEISGRLQEIPHYDVSDKSFTGTCEPIHQAQCDGGTELRNGVCVVPSGIFEYDHKLYYSNGGQFCKYGNGSQLACESYDIACSSPRQVTSSFANENRGVCDCPSNKQLLNGLCVESCADGMVNYNGICIAEPGIFTHSGNGPTEYFYSAGNGHYCKYGTLGTKEACESYGVNCGSPNNLPSNTSLTDMFYGGICDCPNGKNLVNGVCKDEDPQQVQCPSGLHNVGDQSQYCTMPEGIFTRSLSGGTIYYYSNGVSYCKYGTNGSKSSCESYGVNCTSGVYHHGSGSMGDSQAAGVCDCPSSMERQSDGSCGPKTDPTPNCESGTSLNSDNQCELSLPSGVQFNSNGDIYKSQGNGRYCHYTHCAFVELDNGGNGCMPSTHIKNLIGTKTGSCSVNAPSMPDDACFIENSKYYYSNGSVACSIPRERYESTDPLYCPRKVNLTKEQEIVLKYVDQGSC